MWPDQVMASSTPSISAVTGFSASFRRAAPACSIRPGGALAPQNFGALAGALLIGNFGDGHINGYNPTTGKFIGTMHYAQSTKGLQGKPVTIDGLWALRVGNDKYGKSGYANALYFTAGPNGEADGLFGALTPDGLYATPPYPFPGP
jgi:uncharacterized protein (TIGR03118 family)